MYDTALNALYTWLLKFYQTAAISLNAADGFYWFITSVVLLTMVVVLQS